MDTSTETTPTTERQLAPGLRWGIKASFVDYVRRMPDGKGSVGDGAVPVGTGDLFYSYDPAASSTGGDGHQVWAFRGDVRFSGHYGMLFVRIAHPRLEVDGSRAVLTIEDPEARQDAPRVPLVTARLQELPTEDGTIAWGADQVALTAEGVALFNDVYAEGEPFEPLVVQLPA
ncbi:HtaA domain-containing protein [Nocardioides sp. NPDC101246]|uniref:HtaA domain-containing protein n=1 Tax=Nocardioides sp. NPDC101246 TaxID=3364336 RepID=UPI0038095B8F